MSLHTTGAAVADNGDEYDPRHAETVEMSTDDGDRISAEAMRDELAEALAIACDDIETDARRYGTGPIGTRLAAKARRIRALLVKYEASK